MAPTTPTESVTTLRARALEVLCTQHVADKCAQAQQLALEALRPGVPWGEQAELEPPHGPLPGRPERPELIDPAQVPTRSPFTAEGRAALLHAICHIEFNAINLALDAVWRFAGMPQAFYADWLRVAGEEAQHFEMLHALLQDLRGPSGERWQYGSFAAHDGLWAMCEKTAHDRTARMALVPRTLEARGLDATPLIQAKLRKVNTPDALAMCDALDTILRDEIGHVAVGNRWYGWLCQQNGLEPVAHYRSLAREFQAPRLRPPFNTEARKRAGFSDDELAYLLGTG